MWLQETKEFENLEITMILQVKTESSENRNWKHIEICVHCISKFSFHNVLEAGLLN